MPSVFFIGSNSGLQQVAFNFGVPRVQTNFVPLTVLALTSKDIFISKLCWYPKENRYLTFAEMMLPPYNGCYNQKAFDSVGIETVDNTEDEINALVIEMLDRLDGKFEETSASKDLRVKFNSLKEAHNCYINGPIGDAFLQKHSHLLSRAENKPDTRASEREKFI